MMQPLGLGYFFRILQFIEMGQPPNKPPLTSWEVIIRVYTVFPQIMAQAFIVEGATRAQGLLNICSLCLTSFCNSMCFHSRAFLR